MLLQQVVQSAEPRQWPVELRVGRFEIHADFDVSATAPLVNELTSLTFDVQTLLAIEAADKPVHVVLFQAEGEYQRYMRNYFPQLPQRRALFIQDRGPGMLFAHWHADVAVDLRHEITHALLNDGPHPLPLWLDEGLAEYFEVERQCRFDGCDYLPAIRERCSQGLVPSLKQLEAIEDLGQFRESHYRDSWSWVHFLLHRNLATRTLLLRFVSGQRAGTPQLPLSRQLQQISADMPADFQAHFEALSPKQAPLPVDPAPIDPAR
jgi:hypothetical protein